MPRPIVRSAAAGAADPFRFPGGGLDPVLLLGHLPGLFAPLHFQVDGVGEALALQALPGPAGNGLAEVFRSLGADLVVEGGQTMNPSTEDLAEAVNKLACDEVVILPNNKNIVMAAEQVRYISTKSVKVVPSHTIPQGLAALLSYEPVPESVDKMVSAMHRRMSDVKTAQVTYAVKSYQSDVGEVKEGDILGFANGNITAVGSDVADVAMELLSGLITEEDGVISLFYGEEIREAEARKLADMIETKFPHCQLDFCNGGQPFYYYIFSVE